MRELRFQQYAMHCSGGIWTRGTLKDLLLSMPYLLHKFIPSFPVLNDLLQHGVPNDYFPEGILPDGKVQYDAGMSGGCAWKPFVITKEEYEELVLELLTTPELQLEYLDVPAKIKTYSQWFSWQLRYIST